MGWFHYAIVVTALIVQAWRQVDRVVGKRMKAERWAPGNNPPALTCEQPPLNCSVSLIFPQES